MKRALIVLSVAAGVATALLLPVRLVADVASCSLLASSYADAIVNTPKGEDTDFFVNQGGVPNVMFILDTSGSMEDLPPNGASTGWGVFEKSGTSMSIGTLPMLPPFDSCTPTRS